MRGGGGRHEKDEGGGRGRDSLISPGGEVRVILNEQ
jgi:hypothetical protein